ncbi:N-acetylgalactosamine-6-sulfatase-like [Oratosquilla oratoria]|uniref:N-acetylgalactosamine-6-sulfatase-like n=1 Tax=Oratosquilla oratoria TaxID=337810 RepID=UPI003F7681FF
MHARRLNYVLLSLWLAFGARRCNAGNNTTPNVIIMLMDDMGWGDLGTNGEPHRETQALDRMAREGMVATSLYTSAPLCSPSRAALLTGRLPLRNGFYSDTYPGRNAYTPQNIMGGIADSEVLLPELLAKRGYTNALVGKWHLGHREQYLPLRHGFHHFFGSTNCHLGPYDDKRTPNIPIFLDDQMVGRYYEEFAINRGTGESNMTQLYVKHAVDFIEKMGAKEKPFFLYWAPDATHAPTYASAGFLHTSKRGRYGAAVRELDWGVGQILDTLRRLQIHENTFVVFASDNGAALVSKVEGGSNGPFLCGKQTTFEGGMRSPGIFWWPSTIPAGTVTSQLWTQMDFFLTALDIAGFKEDDIKDHLEGKSLDGLSLLDNLKHPDVIVDRPVFLYRGDRLMAVRSGPYKIHLWTWSTPTYELEKGIDYCPGALVHNVTTPEQTNHTKHPVLFDLDTDSGERYPIRFSSPTYKKVVPELLAIVHQHEKTMDLGKPQLNWCDPAVMHWAPPGCKELKKCLPVPASNPTKCWWPH